MRKVMQRKQEENKTYSYTLGKISLNITLRSDIKEDMKNFLEIMEQAKKDISEQLALLK